MGIKRKASFTTVTSPCAQSSYHVASSPVPLFPGDVMTIDETPRHLHSRTRKRFKNDRPDEQSIYDKTIRWLFSAQKQQKDSDTCITAPLTEPVADERPQTSPTVDPTQRTLWTFFQPSRLSSRQTTPSSRTDSTASDLSINSNRASLNPSESGSSSSIDIGMDISTDVNSPSATNQSNKWVGWM